MLGLLLGLIEGVSTVLEAGGSSAVGGFVAPDGDGRRVDVAEVGRNVGSGISVGTKVLFDQLGL
jgi:hypothetical protein